MAAATAAKRQRPQKLSIAGRSSEDKGAGGPVTAETQSRGKVGRAGAETSAGQLGATAEARGSDRPAASAPHTHHWELRNGGRDRGGGGEPGGAGPPQPVTTAGIFRTDLETVESKQREGAAEVGPRASEHARVRNQ